jgi:hypothetical protein
LVRLARVAAIAAAPMQATMIPGQATMIPGI